MPAFWVTEIVLPPVTPIAPLASALAVPPVDVIETTPAAAVVPPTVRASEVLALEITVTSLPPSTVIAALEAVAETACVAAAVSAVAAPVVVMLVTSLNVVVFRVIAAELRMSMFSTLVSLAPVGAAVMAFPVTIFSVSLPAPPFNSSPSVQAALPAELSGALNVSFPAVPVKMSALVVRLIASYSAISL